MNNVLIIDDDTWFAEELMSRLEKAGYAVDCAVNALDGIRYLDQRLALCVILDMFMPGPNGLVLLHELQSHGDLADVPVVMCTNSADTLSLEHLRPYGVRMLLDKTTMQPDDIVTAVRKVTT